MNVKSTGQAGFADNQGMQTFPSEFSELLNAQGKKILAEAERTVNRDEGKFLSLTKPVMSAQTAAQCVRLLDEHLYPQLRRIDTPIPRFSISSMKKNYAETLAKTISMKTCFLQSRRYPEYATAEKIGLVQMMGSKSLHQYAQTITGLELAKGTHQAICYETGDYAGPHNDHHPEVEALRHGYVDLHIMFANDAVDHQFLVHEENRHLRKIYSVKQQGSLVVYQLPFWHYTTPLTAKPGRESEARRWLLLVSFDILWKKAPKGKLK